MTKVWEWFGGLSRSVWFLFGIIFVLLVGLSDYITGSELSFSIFYLVPIAATTWFVGRRTGLFFATVSAICWLAADRLAGHVYSHPAIPYWNMAVRFGFFLITLLALARLKAAYEYVKSLSNIDPLTGVLNGRAFHQRATAEIDRTRRYGRPFSVVYIDLDDFKTINDRFGHRTGDDLLCTVANAIRGSIRAPDSIARLGGDEFALLMPETTEESAHAVASNLRDTVSNSMQVNNWPVTLSMGTVTFLHAPDSVDQMIRLADEVMYSVKRGGKNQIRHEVHRG